MQRKIIIFTIILFVIGSFWLAFQSSKQTNPDAGKNWWAVYFQDPKSNSLDFAIENHSDKTDFHWEISADSDKIKEGDAKIKKGKVLEINPGNISENKKITITASAGDEKKEIYKNFEN